MTRPVSLGDAPEEVRSAPEGARKDAGVQPHEVQQGPERGGSEPIGGIGSGVREIPIREDGGPPGGEDAMTDEDTGAPPFAALRAATQDTPEGAADMRLRSELTMAVGREVRSRARRRGRQPGGSASPGRGRTTCCTARSPGSPSKPFAPAPVSP
jgi:hypothetical protein